jgi:hypothetical protein
MNDYDGDEFNSSGLTGNDGGNSNDDGGYGNDECMRDFLA